MRASGEQSPEATRPPLPVETDCDPKFSEVVAFLMEQGWPEKEGGDGMWIVTPTNRFWFER